MADNVPAKLKPAQIGAYLHRAQQLDRFMPFIAYWCKS